MVLVQKWPFFRLLFFRKYRPGKCLYDILERKTHFCGIKTTSSKTLKIDFFAKELTHCFGSKIAIFLKKKFDIFKKGLTLFFGPKMAIFPTFIF